VTRFKFWQIVYTYKRTGITEEVEKGHVPLSFLEECRDAGKYKAVQEL
jgi:hypothetical protein